jgi:MSHA biogenesis protein MshM
MYLQHFGLTHSPLGKTVKKFWDSPDTRLLAERFQWLTDSPGIGLLTGEAGVGKTAALRKLAQALNPHRYQVIYSPETDFGRVDLYRNLALELGLEPAYRRARLWREIKARIHDLGHRQILPIWIIDEAQNLPAEFFRDLPAFLNFAFDSQDLMTLWLSGHPSLARTLAKVPYAALKSRIRAQVRFNPVNEREPFAELISHALSEAGCQHTLLSDTGMELLRTASQGRFRHAGILLETAMRMAVPKGLNHLPDDLLQEAVETLR